MSKGGAGKVYFILYLAVLLELLIIIVERDDAEDELKKEKLALEQKSKRIQLIAETIINSLRGSATSVSSTSDQSMILGDPKELERKFSVRVRVADPYRDSVKELNLHILRNNQEMQVLNIATDPVLYPRTQAGQDYTFQYSFKPTFGAGEYKLHFDARTNQVVGVTPEATVNDTVKIGSIHLTVGELREVKEGIVENVPLRGYIDSLLGGNYLNFATNVGSNEFTVNVQPPKNPVYDQLSVFPEQNDFAAFPGLELPNPIKIQGAEASKVEITKTDGPGEFVKVDTNWVWHMTPTPAMIGQTYTVRFKGSAKRGGGAKDLADGTFSVKVDKLNPTNPAEMFYPTNKQHKPTPFTGVPFRLNGKFAGLDGSYHTELYLNGTKIKEANEPTIEFNPERLTDEKKTLQAKVFFKSPFMKNYVPLYDTTMVIQPPPFLGGPDGNTVTAGDLLDFKAAFGVAPNYIEIGPELEVSSDGYFDTRAKETGPHTFEYTAKTTSKANNVPKTGKDISVTVTDTKSGQSISGTVHVDPKVVTKGGRGGSHM
jgi:predicted RecA/RadA family phage recombinase